MNNTGTKKVALWSKRHFEEKNGECAACLKYSVFIVVEKKYTKCNIWRVAVRPSYIRDARFLKVNTNSNMQKRPTPHSPVRSSIVPASPPYSSGRILFGTSLYKDSKSTWRCVCRQYIQNYVLLSCFINILFACCCLGSFLSNFKSHPLHRCIISPVLW